MSETQIDIILDSIKKNIIRLQELRDIGVPQKKLKLDTASLKIELARWIKQKRNQNYTYQEIEDILNDKVVVTLSGKGKWDTRTISKIENDCSKPDSAGQCLTK